MSFSYPRQIRFHETDAAGVVYFANVLTLCHEAYEASLEAAEIDLGRFFGGGNVIEGRAIAVPIVHADVDFFRPLHCGDRIHILLTPKRLKDSEFEIDYRLLASPEATRPQAVAHTRHVCIDTDQRQRIALPPSLGHWLAQFSE